jgi:hypothetical protein
VPLGPEPSSLPLHRRAAVCAAMALPRPPLSPETADSVEKDLGPLLSFSRWLVARLRTRRRVRGRWQSGRTGVGAPLKPPPLTGTGALLSLSVAVMGAPAPVPSCQLRTGSGKEVGADGNFLMIRWSALWFWCLRTVCFYAYKNSISVFSDFSFGLCGLNQFIQLSMRCIWDFLLALIYYRCWEWYGDLIFFAVRFRNYILERII